jgi:phosphate/sulfate permease
MKIGVPLAIIIAAIAWLVLYVIIGIPLWIAFVVAGGVIGFGVVGGGAAKASS